MFAVISTNGMQYVVTKGEIIKIPAKIGAEGKDIEFDKVLLFKEDGDTKVGKPYIEGIKVKGIVRRHGKLPKTIIYKFIRRENYRRKRGYRQDYTEVEIRDIVRKT